MDQMYKNYHLYLLMRWIVIIELMKNVYVSLSMINKMIIREI